MKMLELYLRNLKSLGYDRSVRGAYVRRQMRVNMRTDHRPQGRGNRAVRRLNEQRKYGIHWHRPPVLAFNTPGDMFLTRGFRGHRRGIEVI
jgi:hypothetical protein